MPALTVQTINPPTSTKMDRHSSDEHTPTKNSSFVSRLRSSTLSKVLHSHNSSRTSIQSTESDTTSQAETDSGMSSTSVASSPTPSQDSPTMISPISPTRPNPPPGARIAASPGSRIDQDAISSVPSSPINQRTSPTATRTGSNTSNIAFIRPALGSSTSSRRPSMLSRPPAAPSSSSNSRAQIPRTISGSWHQSADADSSEHTAQRMRTLPRLASYTSVSKVPSAAPASPTSPPATRMSALRLPSFTSSNSPAPISLPPSTSMGSVSESETDTDVGASGADTETEDDDEEDGDPVLEDDEESNNQPAPRPRAFSTPASSPTVSPARNNNWTTFAAYTPTPLVTARPSASSRESPSTSYFDFAPHPHAEVPEAEERGAATPTTSTPLPMTPGRAPMPSSGLHSGLLSPRIEAGEMFEMEATRKQQQQQIDQYRTAAPAFQLDALPAPAQEDLTSPRRNSMIELGRELPAYDPASQFRYRSQSTSSKIMPREDEGREPLPDYSCAVHIEGWMPRKVEFTAPGLQANNRAWKRRYVILHGTSIKILRDAPMEAQSQPQAPTSIRQNSTGQQNGGFDPKKNGIPAAPDPSVSFFPANQDEIRPGKLNEDVGNDSVDGAVLVNVSDNTVSDRGTREMHVHTGHYDGATTKSAASILTKSVTRAGAKLVVKHYSLQGAESGLAADYLKKKHVIRVRAEGEQFLLQAADDRGVIDWIEALQAATNIALDLDDRPLPKFITLPRRRRRRAPQDGQGTEAATAAAAGDAPNGAVGREIEAEQNANRTTDTVS